MMIKIFKNLIYAFSIYIILCGTYYLIHGSLEMNPTGEQQEKARIAGFLMILMGIVIGIIGRFMTKKKVRVLKRK